MSALYEKALLEHNKYPHNYGDLPEATARASGKNPLCGDDLSIAVCLEGETLAAVRFSGKGCAIAMAAASIMTDEVKGKTRADVIALSETFRAMLEGAPPKNDLPGLMLMFQSVRAYPLRVPCALLPWDALNSALELARER